MPQPNRSHLHRTLVASPSTSPTMVGHGLAGSSSWGQRHALFILGMSRALRVEEASLLARCGIMVPPNTCLPSGWHLSIGGLPMEPVPTVGTPAMSCAICNFRQSLLPGGAVEAALRARQLAMARDPGRGERHPHLALRPPLPIAIAEQHRREVRLLGRAYFPRCHHRVPRPSRFARGQSSFVAAGHAHICRRRRWC